MKQCPNCGNQCSDEARFCTACGSAFADAPAQDNANTASTAEPNGNTAETNNANNAYNTNNTNGSNACGGYGEGQYRPAYTPEPVYDPYDHTAAFDPRDISDNKVIAMCVYLLGMAGLIIALLASHDSPYVSFHVRQGLKFEVVEVLLGIVTLVLCWTVIVPIAAAIAFVVLLVLRIIAFFSICNGKAKEPAIIRSFGFLR